MGIVYIHPRVRWRNSQAHLPLCFCSSSTLGFIRSTSHTHTTWWYHDITTRPRDNACTHDRMYESTNYTLVFRRQPLTNRGSSLSKPPPPPPHWRLFGYNTRILPIKTITNLYQIRFSTTTHVVQQVYNKQTNKRERTRTLERQRLSRSIRINENVTGEIRKDV